VVIGLGYVGLPLAREAVRSGLSVTGFDTSKAIVEWLNQGKSHVDDISDRDLAEMLAADFHPTTDSSLISDSDVVAICVPTPLSPEAGPDLSAVEAAASAVSVHLQMGQLVVLESTSYPGTTEEVLVPILEESGLRVGLDFYCAFSPERIDPGNSKYGLRNTPKVVGGITSECSERATRFYSLIVDEVVQANGVREAEMTKLLENTYRHVNIALVNEMARFCHELDIDLWDAIRCASTKPFGYSPFYPGPGVGGHCIPIDPNYLSHRVRTHLGFPFRFVELAQEINADMPSYVVRRAQDLLNADSRPLRGSKVLLLGVTYKQDIADQRESPAVQVAQLLVEAGARVSFHDPFVEMWEVEGIHPNRVPALEDAVDTADLIILLQSHKEYAFLSEYSHSTTILDTRGLLSGESVVRL